MKLNLLVIRTFDIHLLKKQYEFLGMKFNYHQHGSGPLHYSSELNGLVFEIYPLISNSVNDEIVRLGFEIENLAATLNCINQAGLKIVKGITDTEWGELAIVQDSDGRKIELKQLG